MSFVYMTEDEVLDHLLSLEAEHGTLPDEVVSMAIEYPMVKTEVYFECKTNTLFGWGEDWKHQGTYRTLREAMIAGQEVCYESDTQRKVHISCDGMSAFMGVLLPGGIQGSFYTGFDINS